MWCSHEPGKYASLMQTMSMAVESKGAADYIAGLTYTHA